jgi:osmotically inducible protein OsmC
MTARNGSAEWRGDLQSGSGTVTVGDGVLEASYSFASRFEEGEGTNPEQLIAAAHAACFTMALTARIDLNTEGRVSGVDEQEFQRYAEQAKAECPVSRALAGVPEIVLTARLA